MRLPEGEARARFATVPEVRPGTADGQLKRLRNAGENPVVTMLAGH